MRAGRAAAALLAVALAGAVPAAAAPQPRSIIEDDAALLRSGPAVRDATLDDMAALGADTVRILVRWRDVATPAAAGWPDLDAAVAGARARGLDVLLTASGPGPIAASRCRPRRATCDPSPAAFEAFVAALGVRYPGVRRWSVWNEPNIPAWLTPQSVVRGGRVQLASPELYRGLVRAAAAALRATGHGADQLLVGETAPVLIRAAGPPATRPTTALRFVRALLARPLPGTGWAHHAYTAGGIRAPTAPSPRAALGLSSLPVLDAELARAARRGTTARRWRVWLDEGGFQTDPPDPFSGVPPATQAAWLAQADWLAWHRPFVRSVGQYPVRDEPRLGSFQSGLRWADGRPKPAWDAYRAPVHVLRRGAITLVWGHVRPRGAAIVAVERRRPGARRWERIAGRRPRTFTLRRRGAAPGTSWRLAWREAGGTLRHSPAATLQR